MMGQLSLFDLPEEQPIPKKPSAQNRAPKDADIVPPSQGHAEPLTANTNIKRKRGRPKKDPNAIPEPPVFINNLPLAMQADWIAEKRYYPIGEVANLFGLPISTIRFWSNEFSIKCRVTRKGDRLFDEQNLLTLKTIYRLVKQEGFTISGAKTKLNAHQLDTVVATELLESLQHLRAHLVRIRKEIKQNRRRSKDDK